MLEQKMNPEPPTYWLKLGIDPWKAVVVGQRLMEKSGRMLYTDTRFK